MRSYLIVFGHTAVDIILQTDGLPVPNSSTAVKEKTIRWGGTGANIAKATADMDVETGLFSFVGTDFPDEYEGSLRKSGVNLRNLVKLEDKNTPTCWIVTEPSGDQMALMDQGAMDDIQEQEMDKGCIKKSEVIHVGTGRPEFYRNVMKTASKFDKIIAFDPAQELKYVYEPDTFKELLKMSNYFFCNETESKLALKYLDMDDIEEMLELTEHIIVTKGDEGSDIYTRQTTEIVPAIEPTNIVDPTGAGDCFRAGFYGGKSRGFDLYECCLIGSARASFALESHGPQEKCVSWKTVIERIKDSGYGIIN